jgi:hypothetical protein
MGSLNLFVRAVADPRVSYFTVTGLFKAIYQVAKPIAQHIPEAAAREQATQLACPVKAPSNSAGRADEKERSLEPGLWDATVEQPETERNN